MLRSRLAWMAVAAAVALLPQTSLAQAPAQPKRELPAGLGGGPEMVNAHALTVRIEALAPDLSAPEGAAAEAQAVVGRLKTEAVVDIKFTFFGDISHQEILSGDFILPKGTVVMHQAGNRYFAIIDPQKKTFIPMDAAVLLGALEGGAGIEDSQYDAKVVHTEEKREIAGITCRKSIVTVKYVSAVPLESEKVFVQKKNDVEVWHTSAVPSGAAQDHLFFKFQRDKTGVVKKVLATEIGFPMEVRLVVSQVGAKKGETLESGSFHWVVTEAKVGKLEKAFFDIPPAGYVKLDKNPYFKSLAP
jgi:hypothetical protein